MKKLFALIAALALPLLCAAQEDENQKANICAYWDKGDRIVYDCSETQYRIFIDGTVEEMGSATETHIIEVLDETDKSYHLRFSYQDVYDKRRVRILVGVLLITIALLLPAFGLLLVYGYKEVVMTAFPAMAFVLITAAFVISHFWVKKK